MIKSILNQYFLTNYLKYLLWFL